ncbi:MAG: metallophosphoesterase, partial [Bacteroidales bacterium]|nr:metallophosphoesterase [Bacteroidales bacterium]
MVPILMVLCFGCQSFEINKPVRIEINVKADSAVFAVIGDYGKDGESEKTVASLVKGWDPDFILTTGDNNYLYGDYATLIQNIGNHYGDYIYNFDAPDAYQCHGKAFQDSINRFFPSPGNHDEAGGRDLEPYLNYFTLPGVEEFYAFTWGNAAFYSISSVSATNIDEQKIWLEKEIGDSKKPFQIVYFHHSPYSPGRHGDTEYMQW